MFFTSNKVVVQIIASPNGQKSTSRQYVGMISIPFRIKKPCPDRPNHQNCPKTLKFDSNRLKYFSKNIKIVSRLKKSTLCSIIRVLLGPTQGPRSLHCNFGIFRAAMISCRWQYSQMQVSCGMDKHAPAGAAYPVPCPMSQSWPPPLRGEGVASPPPLDWFLIVLIGFSLSCMTCRIYLVNHLLALLLFVCHFAFVLNGLSLSPLLVIRGKLILRLFGALRVELELAFGYRITQEKSFLLNNKKQNKRRGPRARFWRELGSNSEPGQITR